MRCIEVFPNEQGAWEDAHCVHPIYIGLLLFNNSKHQTTLDAEESLYRWNGEKKGKKRNDLGSRTWLIAAPEVGLTLSG